MSHRARTFLGEWVRDNHHDVAADAGEACLEALLRDAHSLGMGLHEFEEEVGDVRAYLVAAMNDRSIEGLRRIGESGATDM